MSELTHYTEDERMNSFILRAYSDVAFYSYTVPTLDAINNHYGLLAENELFNYTATLYGDDFYDGSPGKSANFLPDNMKEDVAACLGIPLDIDPIVLSLTLRRMNFFFKEAELMQNSPIQRVW